jgi:hypothetical protein
MHIHLENLYTWAKVTQVSDVAHGPLIFVHAFRYAFDIWYTLPFQVTDQVRFWFWSIDFSLGYGS